MLVAALASAVAALFALQTLSLFTVPPLVANVVITATAIVSIGAVKSLKRKKKARLPKASYTMALTSMSSSGLAFIMFARRLPSDCTWPSAARSWRTPRWNKSQGLQGRTWRRG